MQANGLSVLWYMRAKPSGKVRRRIQELKSPPLSRLPLTDRGAVDLSHNESVRLAADALLRGGLAGYGEALVAEGEVDFLSAEEKRYILENRTDSSHAHKDSDVQDNDEEEEKGKEEDDSGQTLFSLGSGASTVSGGRCPLLADARPPTVGQEVQERSQAQPGPSSVEVLFQSADSRASSMKDQLRGFIRKATTALAIVMDTFSDVEILCDILEAILKRRVCVYLLLDQLHLPIFLTMCEDLNINRQHLSRLCLRSVQGETYCAKSGHRVAGRIQETFILMDFVEVLVGSYSFTWLSGQVHRSMAVLFKGGAVEPFHLEFHRLYASSKPVSQFLPALQLPPLPPAPPPPVGHASSQPLVSNWTSANQPGDSIATPNRTFRTGAEQEPAGSTTTTVMQKQELLAQFSSEPVPPKPVAPRFPPTGPVQPLTQPDRRAVPTQVTAATPGPNSTITDSRPLVPNPNQPMNVAPDLTNKGPMVCRWQQVQTETFSSAPGPLVQSRQLVLQQDPYVGSQPWARRLQPWPQTHVNIQTQTLCFQSVAPKPPGTHWLSQRHKASTRPVLHKRSFSSDPAFGSGSRPGAQFGPGSEFTPGFESSGIRPGFRSGAQFGPGSEFTPGLRSSGISPWFKSSGIRPGFRSGVQFRADSRLGEGAGQLPWRHSQVRDMVPLSRADGTLDRQPQDRSGQ